jgi:hypothetical protein
MTIAENLRHTKGTQPARGHPRGPDGIGTSGQRNKRIHRDLLRDVKQRTSFGSATRHAHVGLLAA